MHDNNNEYYKLAQKYFPQGFNMNRLTHAFALSIILILSGCFDNYEQPFTDPKVGIKHELKKRSPSKGDYFLAVAWYEEDTNAGLTAIQKLLMPLFKANPKPLEGGFSPNSYKSTESKSTGSGSSSFVWKAKPDEINSTIVNINGLTKKIKGLELHIEYGISK